MEGVRRGDFVLVPEREEGEKGKGRERKGG